MGRLRSRGIQPCSSSTPTAPHTDSPDRIATADKQEAETVPDIDLQVAGDDFEHFIKE